MKRILYIISLSLLQIVIFGVACAFVLFDDRYIQRGGSHYSHLVLVVGILGCVFVASQAGKTRKKYLLLLLTIPATI
jgi:hypothetical protein